MPRRLGTQRMCMDASESCNARQWRALVRQDVQWIKGRGVLKTIIYLLRAQVPIAVWRGALNPFKATNNNFAFRRELRAAVYIARPSAGTVDDRAEQELQNHFAKTINLEFRYFTYLEEHLN